MFDEFDDVEHIFKFTDEEAVDICYEQVKTVKMSTFLLNIQVSESKILTFKHKNLNKNTKIRRLKFLLLSEYVDEIPDGFHQFFCYLVSTVDMTRFFVCIEYKRSWRAWICLSL